MTTFKVMTGNVENLYRAGNEYGPDSQKEYERKLKSLADAILHLNPDVLAVQEIGEPEAFTELVEVLGRQRYSHTRLSKFPDSRGIRVGFLSKLAIAEDEELVNFSKDGLSQVISQEEGNSTGIKSFGRAAQRILVRLENGNLVHLNQCPLEIKTVDFSFNRKSFAI